MKFPEFPFFKRKRMNKQAGVILVLSLCLIVSIIYFTATIQQVLQAGHFHPRPFQRGLPTQTFTIDEIRPWMTFEFINRVFHVPGDYLKTTLAIADVKYPRLSISQYAKEVKLDPSVLVALVQSALNNYHPAP